MASPWKFLARLVRGREHRRDDGLINDEEPDILAMPGPTTAPASETYADLPGNDCAPSHDQSDLASSKLSPLEEAGSDIQHTLISEGVRAVKAADPVLSDDANAVTNAAQSATRLERTAEGASGKHRSRRKNAETLAVAAQPAQVIDGAPCDAMSLDQEISMLRRQLASKLQLQNAQLKKMLERLER